MNNSNDNIEKIIRLMQADDSKDAPLDAIKWSKNIFKTRASALKQSVLQSIVAVLVQDLTPGAAAFGERSGSVGKVRQMLFEAGDNRVDLRVSQKEDGFDLRGQILGTGWEGAVVEFAGQKVSVNSLGGFVVGEVGDGIYDLTIKGERIEIVLKAIELY